MYAVFVFRYAVLLLYGMFWFGVFVYATLEFGLFGYVETEFGLLGYAIVEFGLFGYAVLVLGLLCAYTVLGFGLLSRICCLVSIG